MTSHEIINEIKSAIVNYGCGDYSKKAIRRNNKASDKLHELFTLALTDMALFRDISSQLMSCECDSIRCAIACYMYDNNVDKKAALMEIKRVAKHGVSDLQYESTEQLRNEASTKLWVIEHEYMLE
jgi:hypothetical protein